MICFNVNVRGTLFTVQKALPLMKDGGSIILNSSFAGVKGFPGTTVYSVSKAAVGPFARTWTAELKGRIRVNVINPGPIDTAVFEGATQILQKINKLDLHRDKILNMEFEKNFCSWYQAYHYLPREKWGIHIRYDSWLNISDYFNKNSSPIVETILDSVKSAFLYLFVHELFHHIVENAASMLEIISGKTYLYTNAKYYRDIYSQVFNSARCMEEILSNSYLFVWADKCHLAKDFLRQELLKQGAGYCEFIQSLDTKFLKGNRILVSQILSDQLDPPLYNPLEQIIDITDPFEYLTVHNVPVWLHHRAKFVHNKM